MLKNTEKKLNPTFKPSVLTGIEIMQSSAVHVQLLHHSSPTMSLSTLQASVGSHPMKKVAK